MFQVVVRVVSAPGPPQHEPSASVPQYFGDPSLNCTKIGAWPY
jgi:hypothetical protein